MWFIRHDWDDKKKMADCLANLPVDKHQPSSSEVQIMREDSAFLNVSLRTQ